MSSSAPLQRASFSGTRMCSWPRVRAGGCHRSFPSTSWREPARPGANDRIGIGYIGAGRRANQLMSLPPEGRIVAAADFDLSAGRSGGRQT